MCVRMLIIVGLVGAATTFTGCPIVYRGYQGYDGRVLDADTGEALQAVRVIACLLDRYPGAGQKDCATTPWKNETITDADGRFELGESRHLGLGMPVPHGFPGPYDTNLRFEKEGYQTKEFHWWHDRKTLSNEPLIIHLNPDSRVAGQASDPELPE